MSDRGMKSLKIRVAVCGILLTQFSFAQVDLNSGLILCLPFTGDWNDHSNTNTVTRNYRGKLTEDRHGNPSCAMLFNGVNSYLELQSKIPDFTSGTVSCWFYATKQGYNTFFMDATEASGNDFYVDLVTYLGIGIRADKQGAELANFGGSAYYNSQLMNAWHHLVWVMQPTVSKIYLDGVLVQEVNKTGKNVGYHANKPTIGCWWGNDTLFYPRQYYFGGKIDEFRLYKRPLNQQEVAALYGLPSFSPKVTSATICSGGNATLVASGGEQYSWFDSQELTNQIGSSSSLLVSNAIETDSFWVRISAGCETRILKTFLHVSHSPPKPLLEIIGNNPFCDGDTVVVRAKFNGGNLVWSNGLTSDSLTFTGPIENLWAVSFGLNGCNSEHSDTISLSVSKEIGNILADSLFYCYKPLNINTLPLKYTSYSWTLPGGVVDTSAFVPVGADGWYIVKVSKRNCIGTDSIFVMTESFEGLRIVLTGNGLNKTGDTVWFVDRSDVVLTSSLPSGINRWQIDGEPDIYSPQTGLSAIESSTSFVNLVHQNRPFGCEYSVSRPIRFQKVMIPNLITHNEDGKNDHFVIQGLPYFSSALTIYNRWGEPILREVPYHNDWPKQRLSEGPYFFLLQIENENFRGIVWLLN